MSRAVYAPGADRPGNAQYNPNRGAGGQFASYIQGSTPKYALNAGPRGDWFRDTMARMFIRVDQAEMALFKASISDEHTRNQLIDRLAGDPTKPTQAQQSRQPNNRTDAAAARNHNVHTNGYLDFLLGNVSMPLQEKIQVTETLSDNYVLFAFGQSPPIWNFSGVLINTVQDDQASNMFRLYMEVLRATQLAKRQKSISLSFDSYIINGAMTSLVGQLDSKNEIMVPFSFQFVVKKIFITNYTKEWIPTWANTPFAADLNAVPYDGRPRDQGSLAFIASRIPPGTSEVAPVPNNTEDSRTADLTFTVDEGAISVDQSAAPPDLTTRADNLFGALQNQQTGNVTTPQSDRIFAALHGENITQPIPPGASSSEPYSQADATAAILSSMDSQMSRAAMSVFNPARPESVQSRTFSPSNTDISPATPVERRKEAEVSSILQSRRTAQEQF